MGKTRHHENMSERMTGYILLVFGIIIILFSGLNVYLVFTGKIKPVAVFGLSGIQLDLGKLISNSLPTGALPPGTTLSQKEEIIPSQLINDPLNLTAHLFFMGFMGSVGYKLGSLGVMLLRPVVVKMKEKS